MKSVIALMAMVVSINSYAHGCYLSPTQRITIAPTLSSAFTSELSTSEHRKAAETLIRDANDFHQSGIISLALYQQIETVQASLDVSDEEAVDILVDIAEDVLN